MTKPIQPFLGDPVEPMVPKRPLREKMEGRYVILHPLKAALHAAQLYRANLADTDGSNWMYLPYGPFDRPEDYQCWLADMEQSDDPFFFSVEKKGTKRVCGLLSYLRISPRDRSIEIGHIHFSPELQSSQAATEAVYLLIQWAFQHHYRRVEWKCNALHMRSRRAAQRLGFSYEGVFRQATVVKNRNRDTAWFAVIDKDWPALNDAYTRYFEPTNFQADGRQLISLSSMTNRLLVTVDPLLVNAAK